MFNPFTDEIVSLVRSRCDLPEDALRRLITTPPQAEMGDYALPCFPLANKLKRKPNDIAAELANTFAPSERLREAKAAGPYLNVLVQAPAYMQWLIEAVSGQGARFGESPVGEGKTVVIDFSSPNIAKHLGIHHVRTTMIGNALANLYRALGYKVVGINFLGDWGTQFGMILAACKRWGDESVFEGDPVANLNALYVRFNKEAEADPSLRDEARAWFKKLEDGDPEAVAMWRRFRKVSLTAFDEVYQVLGVNFEVVSGESEYVDQMPDTIRRLEEKGLAEKSEGALIVDLSDHKMPPALLRKSDGATLYDTRDIAAAEDRWNQYRFAKMIYVVGGDQKLHFRQLFKVLELMDYPWARECVHVDFGIIRIRGEEGSVKMSTRRGRVIMLRDVLAEAVTRVRAVIEEKNPALENKEKVAQQVGIGAVVFADFKARRVKDVDFDWDEVLNFEGETGPYVQYAHVRLRGILRKFGKPVPDKIDFGRLDEPEELQIAKEIAEFPAAIRRAAESYEPSIIATYLLGLCSVFNGYYHDHRVVSDDEALTAARVALMDSLRQVIANGLRLLGMAAPEQM